MLLCFLWYHEGRERALSGMFDDCHVEAMSMGWLKRDLWKAGIALASMLLLLVFMVWVPVSVAAAHKLTWLAPNKCIHFSFNVRCGCRRSLWPLALAYGSTICSKQRVRRSQS